MKKQKEAVYNAVINVLSENGIEFEEGMIANEVIDTDMKKTIHTILFEGFRANEIELNREYDDAGLKSYVSGLTNNWLRKDKRFNNGTAYKAKNPGSRAGYSDPQIKELRKLLKVEGLNEEQTGNIQEAITKRLAEIKPASVVTIDVDQLPEHLRDLVKA
jgi:hypothetical protein